MIGRENLWVFACTYAFNTDCLRALSRARLQKWNMAFAALGWESSRCVMTLWH